MLNGIMHHCSTYMYGEVNSRGTSGWKEADMVICHPDPTTKKTFML